MADQLHSKLSHRKMPISDQKSLFMKECYHLMWMFLNGISNGHSLHRVNEARRKVEMSSSSSTGGHSKLTNFGLGGYFRLDQHQDQLIFCTDAEIQNNPRFQMIQLRRAKVQEFKNYRMIPILDKEVPKGLLEARTKRALAKGQ